MARPEVTISAPDPLFVGREAIIEINVTAAKETNVDFIDATLTGDQGWRIGSGKQTITERLKFPQLRHRVMEAGVLPAATTSTFKTKFTLPLGVPPTHETVVAWSRMKFFVHISIPWRLDGRYKYPFAVRILAPPVVERTPLRIRSTSEPEKARIELGLGSTRLIAGEDLVGTCAVFHLDDSDDRTVQLSLVPELTLRGRRFRERRGKEISSEMTIPKGSAGTGVPFRLSLPASMTPTFDATTHGLNWWLVARTGSFFGGRVDVAVPIEVVDRSAIDRTPPLEVAPRVGDERIATLFAQFASKQGWKGGDPGAADFAIETEIGDADLRIAYHYRGEEGTFLESIVRWPGLGLGLGVAPASSVRHMFWKDVEVDIAAWDRAHHVKARYPAQAIPFLKAVVPTLMQMVKLGPMIRWSDSEVVFERKIVDVSADDLTISAGQLELLAIAMDRAMSLITAPPSVTVDLSAWRALATKLGGMLSLGDLGIRGTLDGAPVDLGLGWREDQPVSVHVSVGDPAKGSEELRKVFIRLPNPASDVLGANAAERLVDLITRWDKDVVDLHVEHGVASAALLLPGGATPVADAARVRTLVEGLRAVLAALDPGAGPYR